MRRALAAGLVACALAAYAQAPPEAPAPAEQPPPAEAPPAATETPEAQPPPPKPAAPKAAAVRPPAPAAQESPRDAELVALREQVKHLQSELDAERAAALPPPEDTAAGAPPARSPWGWLVATALLALSGGFLLGWRLLDRRIRRKYGGLRIY